MTKLWADFNANTKNGLRLNSKGTIDDLAIQKIELLEGMKILLWDNDIDKDNNPDNLIVEAIASYNHADKIWEAVFDWKEVKHESDYTN